MPDKVAKAYAINDAKIMFVSLVGKAANKHQFLITKSEDGKADFQTCRIRDSTRFIWILTLSLKSWMRRRSLRGWQISKEVTGDVPHQADQGHVVQRRSDGFTQMPGCIY